MIKKIAFLIALALLSTSSSCGGGSSGTTAGQGPSSTETVNQIENVNRLEKDGMRYETVTDTREYNKGDSVAITARLVNISGATKSITFPCEDYFKVEVNCNGTQSATIVNPTCQSGLGTTILGNGQKIEKTYNWNQTISGAAVDYGACQVAVSATTSASVESFPTGTVKMVNMVKTPLYGAYSNGNPVTFERRMWIERKTFRSNENVKIYRVYVNNNREGIFYSTSMRGRPYCGETICIYKSGKQLWCEQDFCLLAAITYYGMPPLSINTIYYAQYHSDTKTYEYRAPAYAVSDGAPLVVEWNPKDKAVTSDDWYTTDGTTIMHYHETTQNVGTGEPGDYQIYLCGHLGCPSPLEDSDEFSRINVTLSEAE